MIFYNIDITAMCKVHNMKKLCYISISLSILCKAVLAADSCVPNGKNCVEEGERRMSILPAAADYAHSRDEDPTPSGEVTSSNI